MFDISQITSAVAAALVGIALSAGVAGAQSVVQPTTAPADEVWAGLVTDVFDDRPMKDGAGVLTLDAPYRAEDAAVVPMTLAFGLPAGDARSIRKVTLVIDNNPSPVAATFEIGETAGVGRIETRVRVNSYTNVHAVAEASDGTLYVTERFVKASGGCSAPAGKDPAEALQNIGKMKLKQFGDAAASSAPRELQVMLRHPQYSGLQMDQVTRNYIPAWFVTDLEVRQGTRSLLKVSGGISLSEDPNIRFSWRPDGADPIAVVATDTDGRTFSGSFPIAAGGS
ncbi:quinoprotein dehydrogenase-associated SoxYZ-like carrier [Oharaeibacter diazotrophicus]|uniref:Sulfur-oxidizing protein SoxY n=1 Tax=Oharaeibacter diazotrophicus TaxID=1920512 RepID=A0A4R6RNB9_9HYPH|nr:quinoprotein dehydrogenase-associated SoxYZ-like carrier [Oharaeibacter diazotrophicus]TDP87557.1 sulfur-oxidizing protein SoxY [Oharaeibacter diazotrophicus]BBE70498.1 sulfur oxidation protein SoxY [Pleomorphomonas sp. SM30]GLS77244.1 quinoprotein dehydrogenase-associated SoxYZ-like carrier [Oharaeibacter diazotrophicus]